MKQERAKICVFGASSDNVDQAFVDAAYLMGKLLAQNGMDCVNGAGAMGLMRAVSDGVLDAGGHVTGVIPKFMVDNGWCYDRLSELVVTPDMHERKQQMAQMTDAVIALPGGCGTLEELLEAITWRQLALSQRPIILLNTCHYYDSLIDMLQHAVDTRFMRASHAQLWTVAPTPQQAIDDLNEQLGAPLPVAESKY